MQEVSQRVLWPSSCVRFKEANVEIFLESGDPQIEIYCHSTQISQVLLNCFSNSIYEIKSQSSPWIKVFYGINEKTVFIRVQDSGTGIPMSVKEKIFNPFFTTKRFGEGVGLGLSICRKIIEGHGGRFYYNPDFANTEFVIELSGPRTAWNEEDSTLKAA